MAPIWVGFWVQTSLNNGSFFGRFSLKKDGFSIKLAKNAKNG